MNTIFDGEQITVDYDDLNEIYRISLFDNNYHWMDEFRMSKGQFEELKDFIKNENNNGVADGNANLINK